MRRVLKWSVISLFALGIGAGFISPVLLAQDAAGKILVDSFTISGTRAIDSAELAEITNSMAGSEFENDIDELGERIRAQFQDRGYSQVEVQKVDVKVLDPLASPKPVRLEAEVHEGPVCRLVEIEFGGYRVIAADDLRAAFPIKLGDIFMRSKIARGLEGMRDLYASRGFLDFIANPKAEISSAPAVKLSVTVNEGPRYRMDKFEALTSPEVAAKLQTLWRLAPGEVYDASYVKSFLEANSSLLPPDFLPENDVEVIKNCPDASVSVYLKLGQDPQAAAGHEKAVECPSSGTE